jgi:ribonuclease HI
VLSRYVSAPAQHHMQAATHVLRYLAGTPNLGLSFAKSSDSNAGIQIYTDSSWGNDKEDRKSTTGIVVRLNGCVIGWLSKKQSTVATSTTEAEYMALGEATREALWYRTWVSEVLGKNTAPIIYSDSQSALALSKNDTYHSRTKHIDITHHFLRDHIKQKRVRIAWISTKDQQADLLTKMLDTKQFVALRTLLLSPTQSNSKSLT